ncbi:hypothetical protein ACFQH2_07460 [Natronoarchaeum sp. GCM10025703]|uniref:hypothetical protein n=1 Tax=unclassified Natronoarchaeum TaxID=2620183 RepID=UPI0036201564
MSAPFPETDDDSPGTSRIRAALYILPFLLLGLANVALVMVWGAEPLWVFVMLPPIIFITVIGWVAFKYGIGEEQGA